MKGFLREALITLVLAAVIYFIIQTTIQTSVVNNVSMQPTLIAGHYIIVIKPYYLFTQPDRGEIIIIHPPFAPEEEWVKRVIGLPGDTVEIKNGLVYVNGTPLDEPYIKSPPSYQYGPFTVPPDRYFVLGDNRNNSTDSHFGWTVSRQDIVGKAWFRIWPLNKWGSPGSYPLNKQLVDSTASAPFP